MRRYSVIPPNAKLPSKVVLNEILEQTLGMLDRMPSLIAREQEGFNSWCCVQAKQSNGDQLFVHEKSQLQRDRSFLVSQHQIDDNLQIKVKKAEKLFFSFSLASFSNVSNLLVRAGQGMESQINSETMGFIHVAKCKIQDSLLVTLGGARTILICTMHKALHKSESEYALSLLIASGSLTSTPTHHYSCPAAATQFWDTLYPYVRAAINS
jgi:hypothetical protein